LNAKAWKTGMIESGVATAQYTIQLECDIYVSTPSSASSWDTRETRYIFWDHENSGDAVSIELYKGSTRQCVIVSHTDNDGSFLWPVSDCGGGSGDNYRIKVTDYDDPDCRDYSSYFDIDAGPWTVSCQVTDDSSIAECNPDLNLGWTHLLEVGNYNSPPSCLEAFYIRFDLSSVPEGATIQSAFLRLHGSSSGQSSIFMRIFMVNNLWNEDDITYNNPGYAWPTPCQVLFISSDTSDTTFSINVSSHVQSWINNDRDNYGFKCSPDASYTLGSIASFNSKEAANYNPGLTVTYTYE